MTLHGGRPTTLHGGRPAVGSLAQHGTGVPTTADELLGDIQAGPIERHADRRSSAVTSLWWHEAILDGLVEMHGPSLLRRGSPHVVTDCSPSLCEVSIREFLVKGSGRVAGRSRMASAAAAMQAAHSAMLAAASHAGTLQALRHAHRPPRSRHLSEAPTATVGMSGNDPEDTRLGVHERE